MRKIIQIVAVPPAPHLHDGYLIALCDDGSVWINSDTSKWRPLPQIPQPDMSADPQDPDKPRKPSLEAVDLFMGSYFASPIDWRSASSGDKRALLEKTWKELKS